MGCLPSCGDAHRQRHPRGVPRLVYLRTIHGFDSPWDRKRPGVSRAVFGSPKGNRTPVPAVRGRCTNRYTMGPSNKL